MEASDKKLFNLYMKSKTKIKEPIGPLRLNNTLISDSLGMATALNNQFKSVFTRDLSTCPQIEPITNITFDVDCVTIREVERAIDKLKLNAAPGPDFIGPRLLKPMRDVVKLPLMIIFNKSLAAAAVPDDWRDAIVTPIYKKGGRADPANYRPVSLTSVCCKLLESILKKHLEDHLENNNLLGQDQHGFRRGRSTASNLVYFYNHITKKLDTGGPVDVIFLDISKAFDRVPHKKLLERLKSVGVGQNFLAWAKAWLTNRRQRVRVGGEMSTGAAVLSGVPQGSVLGPIFFLVYIDSMGKNVPPSVSKSKFADDSKAGGRPGAEFQQAIDMMGEWASQWGMPFNEQKCVVMHMGATNPRTQYTLNGFPLETSEVTKDVGVYVDKSLKFSENTKKAASRATGVLRQINNVFVYKTKYTSIKLYCTYVRPHLEFSTQAGGPYLAGDVEKI